MARIYYQNADGDYIRDGDDAYMTGEPEDCCCVECAEGEEPTAGFSYEQTGDDPCTIDLTDESTVHANCEGTIVEWKWYLNAESTPFSTSQNPTGVEVTDGDDIRLWVKDSCGCTDEVVMAIECIIWIPFTCSTHSFLIPQYMTVDFPSITNGTCNDCTGNGGSRRMKLNNSVVGTAACGYRVGSCCVFDFSLCENGTDFPVDSGGSCPGGAGTGWQVSFAVPVDGVSDILCVARIYVAGTGCGSADLQWRSITLPWQSDFTSFSASLPYNGTSGHCTGTASSNAAVSAG